MPQKVFTPAPDAARVVLEQHVGAKSVSNVLWFYKTDFNEADMEELLDALETWVDNQLQVPMVDDWNADRLVAYDMNSEEGYIKVKDIDYPGLNSDTPSLVGGALVISLYGAKRGPWNRGRLFVSGLAENNVNEYRLEDVSRDAYLGAFQDLIDNPPAGWIWCIASRVYKGELRNEYQLTPVDTISVRNNTLGSQKRRMQKS